MTYVYCIEQLAAALLAMTHYRYKDALNILERVVEGMKRVEATHGFDNERWK